jgi:peptidoglycan-associated lipoprotein
MLRNSIPVTLLVAVALTLTACPKKAPVTTDDMATRTAPVTPPPATDVTPPPAATPAADVTPDPMAGDIAQVNERMRAQGLLGDVFFDYDKAELKTEALDRLAKNADFMLRNRQFTVTIEGHCDSRGTNEYNLALAERRSAAARDYMVQLGVAANRLRTIPYGEERPFCMEENEACWGQNRRGHFVITGRN